ncbi:peptide ABC transporter ATP-binding protein [Celerinatantimonas yamalensis]|uniref:Oligopeptide/dipeptide ABC transporter ATP-binding protein n=1 Tax=Celerinatantimonas yamalensis TaxID=559956 RepID=A0ABW9G3J2_9GAMM
MALLDIRNLTIEIETPTGLVKAVERVSITMAEGEIRALVGESGSGKSLIAKAILGVTKPTWRIQADRMRLGKLDLLTLTPKQRREIMGREIAMIFQEPASCLDPAEKVGEQLREAIPWSLFKGHFWQRIHWRNREARKLLHRVGIKNPHKVMHSYPYQLSDGICQKIMIAMAIAGQPRLLVADEPTTAMETTTAMQILRLLDKLNKLNNTAILLVSHDFRTLADLTDQVTVLYCGQTVESGQSKQVLENPNHPYTSALIDAVPNFRDGLIPKSRLPSLPGATPSLQHLPIGCRLGPRCPRAQRECVQQPPLRQFKGHYFACHYPLNWDENNG